VGGRVKAKDLFRWVYTLNTLMPLKYLSRYGSFLVFFGLGFYIMLHKDVKIGKKTPTTNSTTVSTTNSTTESTTDSTTVSPTNSTQESTTESTTESTSASPSPDYVFFDSPWLAIVKTFTMFIGELEFSNIPVDKVTI
jgi:hypothetical protein